MGELIEPSNWQVEPDPQTVLVVCLDCEHEEETDLDVDTCEQCESENIKRYTWDSRAKEWAL